MIAGGNLCYLAELKKVLLCLQEVDVLFDAPHGASQGLPGFPKGRIITENIEKKQLSPNLDSLKRHWKCFN